jgi:very-short-patch-repair endonuclease
VSVDQLAAAGIGRSGIARRVQSGRLHRVHRGVHAVGHTGLTFEGRCIASVLAVGEGAVASHRAAAAILGLLPPRPGPIDVTVVVPAAPRQRSGIRVHRSRSLGYEATTRHRNIPVTTPARTISDLRRVAPNAQVRRAIREASVLGFDLGDAVEADLTRSELEARFLRLCRRHRLPAPEVNVEVGRFRVDFLWRERGLIVETDGFRYHRGRLAFEEDRARDVELQLHGYDVLRFTHRQVTEDSAGVAAAIRSLL